MKSYPTWRTSIEDHLFDASADPTSAYCQLATVDALGNPHVRTMVYRGFDEVDHGILMCTDIDSDKRQQLDHNSQAQIVWYLSKARTQYRLSGTTEVFSVTSQEVIGCDQNRNFSGANSGNNSINNSGNNSGDLRSAIWRKLSANAKRSFIENSVSYQLNSPLQEQGYTEKESPPSNFAVIKLSPTWVESIDLRSSPHKRAQWRRSDASWVGC